jgi:hypothetical protein
MSTDGSFIVFIFASDMNKCIDIMLFTDRHSDSDACYTMHYGESLCTKHVFSGRFQNANALALKVTADELSCSRKMLESLISQKSTFDYYSFNMCLLLPNTIRQKLLKTPVRARHHVLHSTQVAMLVLQNCLKMHPRIYQNALKMQVSYTSSGEVYDILFPYTLDVDVHLLREGRMTAVDVVHTETPPHVSTADCADPIASARPRLSELLQFD